MTALGPEHVKTSGVLTSIVRPSAVVSTTLYAPVSCDGAVNVTLLEVADPTVAIDPPTSTLTGAMNPRPLIVICWPPGDATDCGAMLSAATSRSYAYSSYCEMNRRPPLSTSSGFCPRDKENVFVPATVPSVSCSAE